MVMCERYPLHAVVTIVQGSRACSITLSRAQARKLAAQLVEEDK